MPYFNTFGGNPVAVAAASATLDVLEDEGLVPRAEDNGQYALDRLLSIESSVASIRASRGAGLFLGAEIVDGDGAPDTRLAGLLPDEMKRNGVLLNVTGRHRNVLKIRPPMSIERDEVDLLCDTLLHVLESLT